eukprot:SAG31_NODE_1302_length_8900_cov_4.460857_4_plen_143_part_00
MHFPKISLIVNLTSESKRAEQDDHSCKIAGSHTGFAPAVLQTHPSTSMLVAFCSRTLVASIDKGCKTSSEFDSAVCRKKWASVCRVEWEVEVLWWSSLPFQLASLIMLFWAAVRAQTKATSVPCRRCRRSIFNTGTPLGSTP